MKSGARLCVGLLLAAGAARANEITFEPRIVIEIDGMRAGPAKSEPACRLRWSLSPGESDEDERPLAWPPGARLHARVTASRVDDETIRLRLAVDVIQAGSPRVETRRDLLLREGSTSLVDVFARDRDRLVLSVRGEHAVEPVARRVLPTAGAPVKMDLAIERVAGDRTVLLETNELHSLVGEPVEYSLDLGEEGSPESIRLTLTPVRISGDLVEVRAEVAGTLPAEGAPLVVQRSQSLVMTRGATSNVGVTSGDPPVGWRFRITPSF